MAVLKNDKIKKYNLRPKCPLILFQIKLIIMKDLFQLVNNIRRNFKSKKSTITLFCVWLFIFSFLFYDSASAATFTAVTDGNWNAGAMWGKVCSGSCVAGTDYPGQSDNANTGSHIVTLSNDQSVLSIVINTGGRLSLSTYTLTVNGNFTNSGTFSAGTGTVIFKGSSNTVLGTNTFYNLTKSETSASSILFDPGATTSVTHSLILNGASGQLLTVSNAPASPTTPLSFLYGWPNGGYSNDLVSDSSGNIFVPTSGDAINKFNPYGTVLNSWDLTSGGGWTPGIAISPITGNIYAATFNHGVETFDSNGNYISNFGGNCPGGVAVDSLGNIYVAEESNNTIQKFNSSGSLLTQWKFSSGSTGTGGCTSWDPFPIAVDSLNNVYVGDWGGDIKKFNSSGSLLTSWSTPDAYYIFGITTDASNNVYVGSGNNMIIQKFDSGGNLLVTLNDSDFDDPMGMSFNSSGDLYVDNANYNNGTNSEIEKFAYIWHLNLSGTATTSDVLVKNSSGVVYSQFCGPDCNDGGDNKDWTSVTSPAITGVTPPVSEVTPVTLATNSIQYTALVSWSPAVLGVFAGNTTYTATITVTPAPGYDLTGVPSNFFTVSGATRVTNSAGSGTVTVVFPTTAPSPSNTVTFNNNGGSGSMTAQTNDTPTALTTNTFTRAGYDSSHWDTAANNYGTTYDDGVTYDFSANVVLYAQWTALPNHTVTFNNNGGSGSMTAQINNAPTALTADTFTRIGYTFNHWDTAADNSGTTYADGDTYSFTSNVILYAQWTINPNATIIISFNFDSLLTIGTVDNSDHTVALLVPHGTTVIGLTPTILVPTGATISPASGVPITTNPQIYTVTAQDGITTQNYTVTVTVDTGQYAWSNNIGWINFNAPHGNFHVGDFNVTGYAWSNKMGWINFDPDMGSGNVPVISDGDGHLSGYAWGENTGWIDFGPVDGISDGVSINPSNGKFSGTATGDIPGNNNVVGIINFSCDQCNVVTDWRPSSLTFNLSNASVGFGNLSSSGARYATNDSHGSSSDLQDALTLSASTVATGGYIITVDGSTLKDSNDITKTISAIGATAALSSPGSSQFGMRLINDNSETGSVSSPYNNVSPVKWALAFPSVIASGEDDGESTVFGVRYICNVSNSTASGIYNTNLMFTVTGVF